MRKIILTIAALAAVGTAAIAPAQARGGRDAAIGLGIAGAAIGTAAAVNGYNNGYYGPRGYDRGPGYYDDGPRVYHRRYQRDYRDNY